MKNKRKQPFAPEEFEEIFSQVPRACVDILIKTDEGVVLTKREEGGWVGMWHIPGGTILYGEMVGEAIERVAMEELGIEVVVEKVLDVLNYPSETEERGFGWSIGVVYLCRLRDIGNLVETGKVRVFGDLPEEMIEEQKGVARMVLVEK